MNELALHNEPDQIGRDQSPDWRDSCVRKTILLFTTLLCVIIGTNASGQGAGELPSKEAIQSTGNDESQNLNGIPVKAFMFLDETGNLSAARAISYDKYLELESGSQRETSFYSFAPFQVDGRVSGSSADLNLVFKIKIDPTKGRQATIPLNLSNFHLKKTAEFTSTPPAAESDSQRVEVGRDGSYVLLVESTKRRTLTVKLSMSAKVDDRTRHNLLFQLPDAIGNIKIRTDMANARAEIFGDEQIRPLKKPNVGGSGFEIDTNGGTFTFYWEPIEKSTETTPRLEVDGTIALNLSQDRDQLVQTVGLDVRDSSGAVSTFQMELPPGSKVVDGTAELAANKQSFSISQPDRANRVTVTIPEVDRKQRVALSFDLTLPRNEISRENPLIMSIPKVIDAQIHQGEIQIQTDTSTRLRWLATNWVSKRLEDGSNNEGNDRFYQFRYDRSDFSLPLWLSENQRQLRLACDTQIKIMNSTARLETTIRFTGQSKESLTLQLNIADWQLLDVTDAETDEPLLHEQSNDTISVDMNLETDAPPPIRIIAEKQLTVAPLFEQMVGFVFDPTNAKWPVVSDRDNIEFFIPRVMNTSSTMVVRSSAVALQSTGRNAFDVNLQELDGVEPAPLSRVDESASTMIKRFRASPGANAKIVGSLIQQPSQITLESNADVQLDADRLRTALMWTVEPRFDLGGSLPVRVPGFVAPLTIGSIDESTAGVNSGSDNWRVKVNDSVARLKSLGGDRYELISSALGSDKVTIQWNQERKIARSALDTEIQTVELPTPDLADVTMRGDVVFDLEGDANTDLYAVDSPGVNKLQFQALPDKVRIRLANRSAQQNELTVRRAVLRTAIGTMTRHEQMMALVQGGNSFAVSVPNGTDNVDVEAFVDRATARVSRTDDSLIIALPDDGAVHLVDLRIWVDELPHGMVSEVKPVLVLPVGAGRIYWQVISPRNAHIVWAAPVIERAMNWTFDKWKLSRKAVRNDSTLADWVGLDSIAAMPPGNQYLYVGSDARTFHAKTMTRSWLWFIVGGFVLGVAWMLNHLPSTRTPFTAAVAAVMYTGLLAMAPDAAVLAGQWAMVGLVLVVVMFAVKAMLSPGSQRRILKPIATPAVDGSTRTYQAAGGVDDASLPVTQSIDAGASASEVSS